MSQKFLVELLCELENKHKHYARCISRYWPLQPTGPLNFVSFAARFLPPTADEKQLALLARALGTAAVLRPELCARQEGDPGQLNEGITLW